MKDSISTACGGNQRVRVKREATKMKDSISTTCDGNQRVGVKREATRMKENISTACNRCMHSFSLLLAMAMMIDTY